VSASAPSLAPSGVITVRVQPGSAVLALADVPAATRQSVVDAAGPGAAAVGVLVHRDSSMATKTLSHEAFELLARLGAGAPVEATRGIVALLLDGLLELDSGGSWIGGAQALDGLGDLVPALPEAPAPDSLAALSWQAVRTCARINDSQHQRSTEWLYRYHRWPVTPGWSRSWATRAAVLATTETLQASQELERSWRPVRPSRDNDRWRIHRHRSARPLPAGAPVYKIYVGVQPGDLSGALQAALPVLTALDVPQFKLAADLYGMLRADKFVCYLTSPAQVHEVGTALRVALGQRPVQAVPFTAGLSAAAGEDGLLSWAADPPRTATGSGSWRGWVCARIARASVRAHVLPSPESRADYVLRRLQLDGVDPLTWQFRAEQNAGGAPW
jgi:hypothetical protein